MEVPPGPPKGVPMGTREGDSRGPHLPERGAPSPFEFPKAERWVCMHFPREPHVPRIQQEPDGDEILQEGENVEGGEQVVEQNNSVRDPKVDACLSQEHCCPFCGDCKDLHSAGRGLSFQQLLMDLAAEHRRSLLQQRMELEAELCPEKAQKAAQFSSPSPSALTADGRPRTWNSLTNILEGPERVENRVSPFDFVSDPGTEDDELPREETATKGSDVLDYYLHFSTGKTVVMGQMGRARRLFCGCTPDILDALASTAIILNSVLAGFIASDAISAAVAGNAPDELSTIPYVLTITFTVIFFLELMKRMHTGGVKEFFCGSDAAWNWFDGIVVVTDFMLNFLESYMPDLTGGAASNFTLLRILRILRISRAVRILRLVRLFRELRMMVFSILHSGWSLIWSLVLLVITMYAFAIYFVQSVAYHVPSVDPADEVAQESLHKLMDGFGDILRALNTLYQSISGGMDWGDVVLKPLLSIHPFHGVVFCFYIFFTTFALLNIITGIFVETSTASVRSTEEEVTQDQLDATALLVREMKKMFHSADRDGSGIITPEEFETYLDMKEVRAHLNALGIEADKAKGLFQLLDLDMSGGITVEEFCFGCMRLKGYAKSVDLASLTNQTKRMSDQWRRFMNWSESQFQLLQERDERLQERLAFLLDPNYPQYPQ